MLEKQLYDYEKKWGSLPMGLSCCGVLKAFLPTVLIGKREWYCFSPVPSKVVLDSGWRPGGQMPLTPFQVVCGVQLATELGSLVVKGHTKEQEKEQPRQGLACPWDVPLPGTTGCPTPVREGHMEKLAREPAIGTAQEAVSAGFCRGHTASVTQCEVMWGKVAFLTLSDENSISSTN